MDEETGRKKAEHQKSAVKSFQELAGDAISDPKLKQRQPTPQPKEMDEIEY